GRPGGRRGHLRAARRGPRDHHVHRLADRRRGADQCREPPPLAAPLPAPPPAAAALTAIVPRAPDPPEPRLRGIRRLGGPGAGSGVRKNGPGGKETSWTRRSATS